MIKKEDIRRGLCFRTCWEDEVADFTVTDEESGEELSIRVPLEPFEFMVTDVYPRMGEVVVMGVERVRCTGSASGTGVRMVDGCLPVRLSVERFLRFFGDYEIVECGGCAAVPSAAARPVTDGSCVGSVEFSVDEFRKEAERAVRLASSSSIDEWQRIKGAVKESSCKRQEWRRGAVRMAEYIRRALGKHTYTGSEKEELWKEE